MKACLDACVLFPSVMREMLLEAAAEGAFEPVWSERILEEWARATRRLPDGAEAIARAAIATMRRRWPSSEIETPPELAEAISLPDADDGHVVASAIWAGADTLVTVNCRDFPSRSLVRHGLVVRDPDSLLLEFHSSEFDIRSCAERVRLRAEAASNRPQHLRPLLKRAGLPRLAKALDPPVIE
jgi:predicted nucleic acid-binding protein